MVLGPGVGRLGRALAASGLLAGVDAEAAEARRAAGAAVTTKVRLGPRWCSMVRHRDCNRTLALLCCRVIVVVPW